VLAVSGQRRGGANRQVLAPKRKETLSSKGKGHDCGKRGTIEGGEDATWCLKNRVQLKASPLGRTGEKNQVLRETKASDLVENVGPEEKRARLGSARMPIFDAEKRGGRGATRQ